MAINKKLIHFNTFENFNSKKLSANAENTLYTVGINGSVQTGDPEILYQSIVYIKDTKQQWTHGLLYNYPNKTSDLENDSGFITINDIPVLEIPDEYVTETELNDKGFLTEHQDITNKQDKLISGTNIKTINGKSILGDGDISIESNSNIQAISVGTIDNVETNTYVKYVAQALTEEQKAQVRENIGVLDVGGDTNIDLSNYATKEELNTKLDTIDDLDAIRTGAAKGATALQSYTEQYKGTVTGVKVNGTTKNPSNGVVDLGTVITSHQDISGKQDKLVSGTNIKTINGESILGEGDITIEGGSSDANVQAVDTSDVLDDVETNTYVKYVSQTLTEEQKAQVRENIGVNSKPILEATYSNNVVGFIGDSVMKHGVIYISLADNIDTTITIENFEAPNKDVVEYVWHFQTGVMPALSLPSYIYWANGELPEIEDDTVYELSITATRHYPTLDYIYKAVLVPFKTI